MPKSIALLHNSQVIVEQVGNVFERIYPEAERINIIDESLLRDIKTKGRDLNHRFCGIYRFPEG